MQADARAGGAWAAEKLTHGYEQAKHCLGNKTVKVIAGVGATTAVLACPYLSIPMAVTTASTAMGLTAATAYAVTQNELNTQADTLIPTDRTLGVTILRQLPRDERPAFVEQSYQIQDQKGQPAVALLMALPDAAARQAFVEAVTTLQIPLTARSQALEIYGNLPEDERGAFIALANQLHVDPNQKIHCLIHLHALPANEREEFVRLMRNFQAPSDKLHLFAPILAQMPSAARTDAFIELANNFLDINDVDCKLRALKAYVTLPEDRRSAILQRGLPPAVRAVVSTAATDNNRVKVFEAFVRIGEEFENAPGVQPILPVNQPAYQNWEIALDAISHCPADRRETIYNEASRIYGFLIGSMKNPDCAQLAKLIELLNKDSNLDVANLIREAGKACNFWMNQYEKLQIIQAMAELLPKERERAIGLINPFMSVSERVAVIKACRQATNANYQLARRNISWWMGGAQRAKILEVFSTCREDSSRNGLLAAVQPVLCWSRRAEILQLERLPIVAAIATREQAYAMQEWETQRRTEERQRVEAEQHLQQEFQAINWGAALRAAVSEEHENDIWIWE